MAGPCLYVYPLAADGSTGSLERVVFPSGVGVEAFEHVQVRARVESQPPNGRARFANFGAADQVTIRIGRLTEASHGDFLARLVAIDSALGLGSIAHFTFDRDKAGAFPMVNATVTTYVVPVQGASSVYHDNDFLGLEAAPALDADDYVVIETEPPESHVHCGRITAWGGLVTPMTFDTGNDVAYNTSASFAYCRWWKFYPWLVLTEDSLREPRLRRGGPMTYEWSATFRSQPQGLFEDFPEEPSLAP